MNGKRLARRDLSHFHSVCVAALVCASLLCAALPSHAQDAAEAARQEKARKAAQSQRQPPHVYTNDDLQQPQILTPEDRPSVEARKKNSAPPTANETLPANAPTPDAAAAESLGEISRRLRREKAARQLEQAHKFLSPSPFAIELPKDATLAHPKPLSQPLAVVSPAPATRSIRPETGAVTGTAAVKRDPFSHSLISEAPRNSKSSALLSKPVTPSKPSPFTQPAIQPATVRNEPTSRPGSIHVQSGDSLWSLSRRYLGKGSLWRQWLNHNPALGDPRRMQPGEVLLIPPLEPRTISSSDAGGGDSRSADKPLGTVSVQPGDSLWKLAAQHLHRGSAWPCLAHANPDLHDVARIYPGHTLVIPAACAVAQSSPKPATPSQSNIL
jgi:nucleoid-associated protein YgaU